MNIFKYFIFSSILFSTLNTSCAQDQQILDIDQEIIKLQEEEKKEQRQLIEERKKLEKQYKTHRQDLLQAQLMLRIEKMKLQNLQDQKVSDEQFARFSMGSISKESADSFLENARREMNDVTYINAETSICKKIQSCYFRSDNIMISGCKNIIPTSANFLKMIGCSWIIHDPDHKYSVIESFGSIYLKDCISEHMVSIYILDYILDTKGTTVFLENCSNIRILHCEAVHIKNCDTIEIEDCKFVKCENSTNVKVKTITTGRNIISNVPIEIVLIPQYTTSRLLK